MINPLAYFSMLYAGYFQSMNEKMNYTTVEELLLSDGFLKWFLQTDEKEVQAWDEWIAENPEHQHLASEAVQVLHLIRKVQENKIAEQEIKAATTRLTNVIRDIKSSYYQPRIKFENK